MCGIVGAALKDVRVTPFLIDGLNGEKSRGYDSAGVTVIDNDRFVCCRSSGKLEELKKKLDARTALTACIGIGHTRWATHGKATEANAHPHATDRVAVVHNGIIENWRELRQELEASGVHFSSETDSEVAVHLVAQLLEAGATPLQAVRETLLQLRGNSSFAFLFRDEEIIIGARQGAPLAVGYGKHGMYLGSGNGAFASASGPEEVSRLKEGDVAVISRDEIKIFDASGQPAVRARHPALQLAEIDKGGYPHHMVKEIYHQYEMMSRVLTEYFDNTQSRSTAADDLPESMVQASRIVLIACGSSYYVAMTAKYLLEKILGISVEVDIASEARYRAQPKREGVLTILISQSGETADTLAALRRAKEEGNATLSLINAEGSTMASESDRVLPIMAGPEIGVASTKAFTCALAVLDMLALAFAQKRGLLKADEEAGYVRELISLPRKIQEVLRLKERLRTIAIKHLARATNAFYIARGPLYPIALEGALKLKEISYIHAEGYAAGELKHGPLALVDERMPIIVIAPSNDSVLFEKTMSNMEEGSARDGEVILLTDADGAKRSTLSEGRIVILPDAGFLSSPFVYAVAVQLLAYHTAVAKGTDVDQPRNLAKSVTVE